MSLTLALKEKIAKALIDSRDTFSGSDKAFAQKYDINPGVYSQIINGASLERILSDAKWVNIARMLNVSTSERSWITVKTEVYLAIESDVLFCKEHAKAMIFVDDCEIGKTVAAKHLAATLRDVFYIDASQCKTKRAFILALAQAIGIREKGRYADIKENIKWYLKAMDKPIVIIDEAGDLEYSAFLELKEFWNATDGLCGWYMIGADGLKAKIVAGIDKRKVGFREIFSRFSGKFQHITPLDRHERQAFQKRLLTDVLSANMSDKSELPKIIGKCLANDGNGLGGLRRAESLLIFSQKQAA